MEISDDFGDVEKEAVNFMQRNIPTAENKQEMLAKFSLTRAKRVSMVADKKNSSTHILKCFPRLTDMIETVMNILFHFNNFQF